MLPNKEWFEQKILNYVLRRIVKVVNLISVEEKKSTIIATFENTNGEQWKIVISQLYVCKYGANICSRLRQLLPEFYIEFQSDSVRRYTYVETNKHAI